MSKRSRKGGQHMSFRDALDLVPDDLPDGAYFAMAHEMAALEYGDGFAELAGGSSTRRRRKRRKSASVPEFTADHIALGLRKCSEYHWQARIGQDCFDCWPSRSKWRFRGKTEIGSEALMIAALKAASQEKPDA